MGYQLVGRSQKKLTKDLNKDYYPDDSKNWLRQISCKKVHYRLIVISISLNIT